MCGGIRVKFQCYCERVLMLKVIMYLLCCSSLCVGEYVKLYALFMFIVLAHRTQPADTKLIKKVRQTLTLTFTLTSYAHAYTHAHIHTHTYSHTCSHQILIIALTLILMPTFTHTHVLPRDLSHIKYQKIIIIRK